jgi:hypothetical protein
VYAGRPTAAFVAEGAAKGVTGAEFTQLAVDVKKMATIVLYTEEVLEDAQYDPQVLVNADVGAAFTDLIDAHILGYGRLVDLDELQQQPAPDDADGGVHAGEPGRARASDLVRDRHHRGQRLQRRTA